MQKYITIKLIFSSMGIKVRNEFRILTKPTGSQVSDFSEEIYEKIREEYNTKHYSYVDNEIQIFFEKDSVFNFVFNGKQENGYIINVKIESGELGRDDVDEIGHNVEKIFRENISAIRVKNVEE